MVCIILNIKRIYYFFLRIFHFWHTWCITTIESWTDSFSSSSHSPDDAIAVTERKLLLTDRYGGPDLYTSHYLLASFLSVSSSSYFICTRISAIFTHTHSSQMCLSIFVNIFFSGFSVYISSVVDLYSEFEKLTVIVVAPAVAAGLLVQVPSH